VQIAFSPHPVTITVVNATVQQLPAGDTDHQVLATLEDDSVIEIKRWTGRTVEGQVLVADLRSAPVSQVKILRINSITSPSWISWQGVQVFGYY
jgi:hypothetical protein